MTIFSFCTQVVSATPSTLNPSLELSAFKPMDNVKCILGAVDELVRNNYNKLVKELEAFETAIQDIRKENALCVIDSGINFVKIFK